MNNRFLHAEGTKIVNGAGKEILLKGWGMGNWLLAEGYMWLSSDPEFDRPSRIRKVIEELTGKEYSEQFWQSYRENYVNRNDIMRLAQLGYNSVRIPLHYRLFMSDETPVQWKEEGFALLDCCLEWCEEAGIYAFLDLHAAPGGQTGHNIDDSADDVPHLFLEEEYQEKCIALWVKLAERYRDREIVGGYDLLNEPIAPPRVQDFDALIPKLASLYERLIKAVRKVDAEHLFSIEGAHWATDTRIFDHRYDDNMVLHFHRYAVVPDTRCLQEYMDVAERLELPLWLGETGENLNEWYTAIYPLVESLGIGYNLWTWKKMDCTNSPYSIKKPTDYDKIMDYVQKGIHPGEEKAREILDEYLENCKIENCVENLAVTRHVMRWVPFGMRATDFDEVPGNGISFAGTGEKNPEAYRGNTGMRIVELHAEKEKRFYFDCGWDRFGLLLKRGEFACYQVNSKQEFILELSVQPGEGGALRVEWKNETPQILQLLPGDTSCRITLSAGSSKVKISGESGEICLEHLAFYENAVNIMEKVTEMRK